MTDALHNDRNAAARLRAANMRLTPARLQVLATLLDAEQALTHQQIAMRLEPKLDRVTLYRTLDVLTQRRVAHKLIGADRISRFNAAPEDQAHPHFQCTQCGRFFCLASLSASPQFHLPEGFELERAEITLRGRCAACRTAHLHNAT